MGSSSAPEFPFPGGVAGAEPPDPEVGKPGHFAWSRWIKAFVKKLDAETVKRSGDVMTGLLTLAGAPTAANHAATKAYVDASQRPVPIGAIMAYGGTTAPNAEWHLCDGSSHGSTALQAVTGSARTPDLRGRFIVAANYFGGDAPALSPRSAYAVNATGGADAVALTANQSGMRQHGHVVDPPNAGTTAMLSNQVHSHGGWTGGGGDHVHQVKLLDGNAKDATDGQGVDSSPLQGWNNYPPNGETIGGQGAHNHPIGIGDTNIDHSHHVNIPAFWSNNEGPWNAAEAHENRPPYYALTYIIKKA
jgi:microcystin-dependent protein